MILQLLDHFNDYRRGVFNPNWKNHPILKVVNTESDSLNQIKINKFKRNPIIPTNYLNYKPTITDIDANIEGKTGELRVDTENNNNFRPTTSHIKNNSMNLNSNRPYTPSNPYSNYNAFRREENQISQGIYINYLILFRKH